MKKSLLFFVLVFSLVSLSSQLLAKEYIVKLKGDVKDYDVNYLLEYSNSFLAVKDIQESVALINVDVDTKSINGDPRAFLKEHFDAHYVVENVQLHAFVEPKDPRQGEQWALEMVNAAEAWGLSQGSHEVVVAVIDTGMDLDHEDLSANLWTNANEVAGNGKDDDNNGYVDDVDGWDFHGKDNDPTDETGPRNPGHGTHCAGIVGAACGNEVGICGISPVVSLMPLRFLDKNGSGDLFASTKAVEYAVKNGAHVISASWGASIPESTAQPIIDAIKDAEAQGLIFVAAAANDGKSNDKVSVYPANAQTPHFISVAASDSGDNKPSWSNYGRKVDIAAPGADILSTIPGGYQKLSGTSMATPMVAGIVALMKSADMSLDGATARSILQSTGAEVKIQTASNRRVDAHKALEAVYNKSLTVVPAAATLKPDGEKDFGAWGGVAPYTFASLNPDVATIDESGHLVAVKEGDVTIEVTDAEGNTAQSVSIKVALAPEGGGADCPLPNEMLCMIACGIMPDAPWCDGMPLPELPELPIPF